MISSRSLRMVQQVLKKTQENNFDDKIVNDFAEETVESTSHSEYCPSEENCSDVFSTGGSAEVNEQKSFKQQRIRRKHRCPFCDVDVGNFSRHLERNHNDEISVQEFMSLDRNSKKRKKLIDRIRREGDFCTSSIVPVMTKDIPKTEYIACKFCRGYYARKSLRRHAKKCYFNSDPSKRFNAQIEGQSLMCGNLGSNDILRTSGLFNMLRADPISLAAKKDAIICEVGRRYLRSHRQKHLIVVAKRNMRRLSRLMLSIRKMTKDETLSLANILTARKFKMLIAATKEISGYDDKNRSYQSPSLALQMGTIVKSAINAAYSMEIQKENSSPQFLEELKALTTLIETDWVYEVSSEAGQNLAINKFNKPTLIPMAEDIVKFEKYLKDLIVTSKMKLIENPSDAKSYKDLQEAIFSCILIFNKRRVGELQRMTLMSFLKNYDTSSSSYDFLKALTESERILWNSLKRIVIRGKRGRGVPVLFEKEIVEAIEFSITLRDRFALKDNVYLFGISGNENPITGYPVIRKHAKLALGDTNKASLMTSTKLRKHLATIVQILKMDRNELEQLATFMGHTEKTHSQFYRLPDDIYQTAKVSKLLLLSKSCSIEQYKGKSLTEIDIDTIPDVMESQDGYVDEVTPPELEREPEPDREIDTSLCDKSSQPFKTTKNPKAKRVLISWTENQKKLTEKYFKDHIKKRIPAKKDEVMDLIKKHPGVFDNKTWKVIKVYVQNKYTQKKNRDQQ